MYKNRLKRLAYAREYRIKNREHLNSEGRELYHSTLPYQRLRAKKYYESNKDAFLKKSKRNYKKNKDIVCKRAILWRKNNPFKARISIVLTGIKARCRRKNHIAYKHYGKKGIKCYLTFNDLVYLWERDNAGKLDSPSVDRIDNSGPYSRDNCRYIERAENSRKSWRDRKKSLV